MKYTITYTSLLMMVGLVLYVIHLQEGTITKLEERTQVIEKLVDDRLKGKRVDPFRCSDAEHYLQALNVDVDCKRIESEVNNK